MLYTFQTNVYNERLSPQFGRTIKFTIAASNEKEAYENAKVHFNNLIISLNHYHHNNIDGKIENYYY